MRGTRPPKPVDPLKVAEVVGELGGTEAALARALNISPQALTKRKRKQGDLVATLKKARAEADAKVEKSLYQRAIGYEHDDTHFASYEGRIISKKYRKHYPPDVVACIYWLNNRQRDRWSNRQDTQINMTQVVAGVPDEVLAGLKRLAALTFDKATKQLKEGKQA